MTIIILSGTPGCGKTSISKLLLKKLKNYKLIHLNDMAEKYFLNSKGNFNLDKLLFDLEKNLNPKDNLIIEGHFSHFINPILIKYCFVLNRCQKNLIEEYKKRKYDKKKIDENLLCENMNIIFYEAIENGFVENENLFLIENNLNVEKVVDKIYKEITFN